MTPSSGFGVFGYTIFLYIVIGIIYNKKGTLFFYI